QQNGLQDLRLLNREQMREIEPHVGGIAALHVPQEGIVDYLKVCEVLQRKITEQGGRVVTQARVTGLLSRPDGWQVQSTAGDYEASLLINCAGLHCDRVGELAGETRAVRIVPFRGEYYFLKPERAVLVRGLIYPVVDPALPFLGVHFTRTIDGRVEAGPNAVLAFAREGYTMTRIAPREMAALAAYPGFWGVARRWWRTGAFEFYRSLSKDAFVRSLRQLVPDLRGDDVERGGAGVRAQAVGPDGALVDDFRIIETPTALHVINAPSPAATASLTIGEHIATRAAATWGWA
ncbi:MAG: L-2-hydroxyglutarate oxidase, partial [Anaerolineae bacterium]|nr:L-2-hydroxyglutarate oxidase [Anaerolineae bacterium]